MGSFCRIAGELTCAKCRDKATLKKNAKEPAELATCRGCKKPVKDGREEVERLDVQKWMQYYVHDFACYQYMFYEV